MNRPGLVGGCVHYHVAFVRIGSIRVVIASLLQLNGVLHVDAVCMVIHSVLLTASTCTCGTVPVTSSSAHLEQTSYSNNE